ncbi:MAG: hypothetical protein HYU52_07555 [Acidobacteria bacterium]|nr:hypothetical protein [Acidobacteriota bacterium]
MNDDDFLKTLRAEGSELRFDPGEVVLGRIEARVRSRLSEVESISETLARWLRPLAGAMFAAAAISVATLVWLSIEPADALLASADVSIVEDYYRVAR